MIESSRLPGRLLTLAVLSVCTATLVARAVPVEPAIIPTVHPTLSPTSAIPVPLLVRADKTSVWQSDLDQRMFCSGRVVIGIGYRSLHADAAAIWLSPSREAGSMGESGGGENIYDVAIYLSGNVSVGEGDLSTSTLTRANELLVTTRISRSVQLAGTPVSQIEDQNPIVARGEKLRQELLNRPPALVHIPHIVVTTEEKALQSGWIAKGPNNRIIPGPGEIQVVRGPHGEILTGPPPGAAPTPKPRPEIIVMSDSVKRQPMGNEIVSIIQGAYLLYTPAGGGTPMEFHAQRMVLFSPLPGAATTAPAGASSLEKLATQVTGAYLEGDVTMESGLQSVRASRLYIDFTSYRAIMLDATLSTVDEIRKIPLYMRADQIRMLSRSEFAAKKATFSTSEFFTPHYAIGADDLYLQDVTARDEHNKEIGPRTYAFTAKDATIQVQGVPVFYWPFLAGDTSKNLIPLRRLRVGNSKTYGLSIQTDWDIFGLAGQSEPRGLHADLDIDYFSKRGPAGGVQSRWDGEDYNGLLRSYIIQDNGTDRLGADRTNIALQQATRGRFTARHRQDLGDGWSLSLEGSYISDPNFLEQYFGNEFNTDKEHETSAYLKKQGETDALSFLGKFSLFDFTATADQVDDQFSTEKRPEVKYWRIGDSFFDMLTYYSESGAASLHTNVTNFTPAQLGLASSFLGPPVNVVPLTANIRQYYKDHGINENDVMRGDTRQEIDLPLQIGDLKITPYVTGRVTAWDTAFPEGQSGDTTRLWGQAGFRSSMAFWKVYDDVQSTFWDVHRIRHVIEPQFAVFETGSSQSRNELQLFDPDVEGISKASGTSLAINQKWQTKRGGPGHWRNVDWIVFNVQWNYFWNKDDVSTLYPLDPLRGFYFPSRPELSLVRDSVAADGVWRVGEWARIVGEFNYNTDDNRVEQFATGVVVDQTSTLSYFFGNRYVRDLGTDQWTVAADYQLTKKYRIIATESYDFQLKDNILSSFTLVRKLPRLNTALTVTYDANQGDTTVVFTAWPEGFPEMGIGSRSGSASAP